MTQFQIYLTIFLDTNNENDSEDSEYLPSTDEEKTDAEDGEADNTRPTQIQRIITNTTKSSNESFDTSEQNDIVVCDDEKMYVDKSNSNSKKNYCVFCMKSQSQLVRHLERVHHNEADVKKFAILPKKNPERLKIIDILRKNGNFKFNTNSKFNDGQLIVCRRPKETSKKTAADFIACMKCKGFFAKSTIRKHSQKCLEKNFKKHRSIMIMGRKVTGRIHQSANKTLRNIVFPVLREDNVTRIIRYDKLLILYANKLCIKYKAQHQHEMIRARLRILGRFLLTLKEKNRNVEDFQSLYHSKMYDDCSNQYSCRIRR